MGGGHVAHSKPRAMPGQTGPACLEELATGRARPADQCSPKPGPFWILFLCFLKCLPLIVVAAAGVTVGTTTSAAAPIASAKTRMANSPIGLSWGSLQPAKDQTCSGLTCLSLKFKFTGGVPSAVTSYSSWHHAFEAPAQEARLRPSTAGSQAI